ncbi:excisionase [Sodalis sp. RH24]|uniref:excisionase n=1 Tax=unclassified Sodalis (in: enterobacteria) TaxID=2636512 RepID=UPI0039B5BCC3
MAKLLNLQEWANEVYSTPPSLSTLRRWVREGRIYPAPELHGKEYRIIPGAIYVDPKKKALKRIAPRQKRTSSTGTLLEKIENGEKAGTLRR